MIVKKCTIVLVPIYLYVIIIHLYIYINSVHNSVHEL